MKKPTSKRFDPFSNDGRCSTPGTLDLQVVEEDPEDNTILAAAVEGRADCIISGDRHLKTLSEYQGISILSPAEFVARYNLP